MNTWYKSRQFWTIVVDAVLSIATFLLTKYLAPEAAGDVLTVIGFLQPVIALLVVMFTVDDTVKTAARAYLIGKGMMAHAEKFK